MENPSFSSELCRGIAFIEISEILSACFRRAPSMIYIERLVPPSLTDKRNPEAGDNTQALKRHAGGSGAGRITNHTHPRKDR